VTRKGATLKPKKTVGICPWCHKETKEEEGLTFKLGDWWHKSCWSKRDLLRRYKEKE
jgi:hypothetical protein